mgnify:CR=1 FL=1
MDKIQRKFLENWMEKLSGHLAPTRLIDALIPGSHDSNTYILNNYIQSPFGRCQNITIAEQLRIGVRYLDIRYGQDAKDEELLIDQHGPLTGGNLWTHIIEIKEFCLQHEHEIVIVKFQNESPISKRTKELTIKKVSGILGDLLVSLEDLESWFNLSTVTFGDMWSRPKRIIFLSRGTLYSSCEEEALNFTKHGILSVDSHKVSKWHDVNNVSELFRRNLEGVETRPAGRLFVSQFILSIERDIKSIVKTIMKFQVPTIISFAHGLLKNYRIRTFLVENLHKNFNILLFDYVNFDLELLLLIICSNVRFPLKIHKAFAGSKDITARLEALIPASQILLVPSVNQLCQSLKVPHHPLTLIYSYGTLPLKVFQSRQGTQSFTIYNRVFEEQASKAKKPDQLLLCFASKIEIVSDGSQGEDPDFLLNEKAKHPNALLALLVKASEIMSI